MAKPASSPKVGESEFLKALNAQVGVQEAVKQAAKARDENEPADIPDGLYVCKTFKVSTRTKDNKPMVTFHFMVTKGDAADTTLKRTYFLSALPPKPGKQGITLEQRMDDLAIALQKLGYDTSEFNSTADIPPALAWVIANKPSVQVKVATNGPYQNIYLNKAIKSEAEEGAEEEDDGGSGEASDAVEDSPEDAVEETTEESVEATDEEPVVIEKDDLVRYKPSGEKRTQECKVQTSDPNKKVCTLVNMKTKAAYKNVDWDAVEPVYDS